MSASRSADLGFNPGLVLAMMFKIGNLAAFLSRRQALQEGVRLSLVILNFQFVKKLIVTILLYVSRPTIVNSSKQVCGLRFDFGVHSPALFTGEWVCFLARCFH